MERLVQTHFIEVFDEAFRIVLVILIHRFGKTDVRRLFENAFQRQQAVTVRIGHFRATDDGRTVAGIVFFVETGPGIVEQRNQRCQLLRGTGLHVHPDRVVVIFDDVSLALAGQVRDRTDFAGGNLHQDRRPPIGLHRFELLSQRFLGHVLDIDVERRHHVDTVHRIDVHLVGNRNPERSRNTLHQHVSVDTVQHAIESALDTDFRPGLVHHADRALGHIAVRQQPTAGLLSDETAPVLPQPEYRETGDLFYFQMIDASRGQQHVTVFPPLPERIDQFQLISALAFVAEKIGQAISQRIDVAQENRIDQSVGGEVHPHFVLRHRSGQNTAVAGEDIAPVGFHRHPLVSDSRPFAAQPPAFGSVLQIQDLAHDHQADDEKQHIEHLHAMQYSFFDIRFAFLHTALLVDDLRRAHQLIERNAPLLQFADDLALPRGDHPLRRNGQRLRTQFLDPRGQPFVLPVQLLRMKPVGDIQKHQYGHKQHVRVVLLHLRIGQNAPGDHPPHIALEPGRTRHGTRRRLRLFRRCGGRFGSNGLFSGDFFWFGHFTRILMQK